MLHQANRRARFPRHQIDPISATDQSSSTDALNTRTSALNRHAEYTHHSSRCSITCERKRRAFTGSSYRMSCGPLYLLSPQHGPYGKVRETVVADE
jgi:hypothetical protein